MFRDILSGSRALLAGLVFFVLIVGGSLLYSWHIRRSDRESLERTQRLIRQLETRDGIHSVQEAGAPTASEELVQEDVAVTTADTPAPNSLTMGESAIEDDLSVATDMSDAFIEETEEAPYGISPYGFGPFPEIPSDYPDQDIWSETALDSMEPDHELISRVRIKLWNQGVRTIGGVYDDGYRLIYPIIDDVVYIEWADNPGIGGKPYVRRQLTTPAVNNQYYDDILKGIFPPHLTIYEFPDGGIDPYEFLDLPK